MQLGNKLDSYYKKKVGDKWENINGMPPFPEKWFELSERKQKDYFWDVEEFFQKELDAWRAKHAPTYDKYEQHESQSTAPPATTYTHKQLTDYQDDLPFN